MSSSPTLNPPWRLNSWSSDLACPTLKGLLDDLGAGMPMNEGLPNRTKKTLDQIDGEFAGLRERARESRTGGDRGKSRILPVDADSTAVEAWLEKHPKSFWGLKRLGARLVVEGKWARSEGCSREAEGDLSGIRRAR